jgi:hypothetical protein
MEAKWAIALFAVVPLVIMLISSWRIQRKMDESNNKLIKAQQETIQRLINREPVTYQETGAAPPKQSRETYAAWGAQMVNLDEDEGRS